MGAEPMAVSTERIQCYLAASPFLTIPGIANESLPMGGFYVTCKWRPIRCLSYLPDVCAYISNRSIPEGVSCSLQNLRPNL